MNKLNLTILIVSGLILSREISAHEHPPLLNPKEEVEYFNFFLGKKGAFPSTKWNECTHRVSGNYVGYKCARNRRISNILFNYMGKHLYKCISRASKSVNVLFDDFHIVHKGIFADSRHSSRSLHSEGRAIDIKEIRIRSKGQGWRTFDFYKYGSGKFFSAFRSCWGKTISESNKCPVFKGNLKLTGSIGKEDKRHQQHLHLSVPYCGNGRYLGNYFRR